PALADLLDRFLRPHPRAPLDDWHQQGAPARRCGLVIALDDVALEFADAVRLLATGPGALAPGDLDAGRMLRVAVEPDELVDRPDHPADGAAVDRAEPDPEVAADPEPVDRCARAEDVGNAVLVDVAAGQHLDVLQPGGVQALADH